MHNFDHFLAMAMRYLILWKSRGLNSLEPDLSETIGMIQTLKNRENGGGSNLEEDHLELGALQKRYGALQRQISLKWAQRARVM